MKKEYKPLRNDKEIELSDEYFMIYELLLSIKQEIQKARLNK